MKFHPTSIRLVHNKKSNFQVKWAFKNSVGLYVELVDNIYGLV